MARGPRRRQPPATNLARLRHDSGYTQREMVRLTGLSRHTYMRLEAGQMDNPPLRYLVNCAQVLRCTLGEVIDEQWRQWKVFSADAPGPPAEGPPRRRPAGEG